ncbi:hypothetical protein GCM10011487_15540 [Steroidobacter agaridevorans]|uniref:Glycerophosphoryl diester phosphodiesterase membrane domain-containing protein n=1 Tax=Steroidobacter agaridevorans TaxID=2695856 RepID=A0A829Y8E0_9GAMM|nr:hypothetical protein [Steroidobacter agaridevorans]GFE79554.1 hypothetical protein GCM10011487_15540 [Steroidobacter agaridevorans]
MAIQPTQPQGVGGVLDTAFQLYKSSLGVIWPIALLVTVLSLAPFVYLVLTGVPVFDPTATAVDLSVIGNIMIAVLISLIPSTWGMSAMFLKQEAIGSGGDLSTGAAFQTALQRLPTMIVALVLYMLALTVGFVLLIVPCVILALSLVMYMSLALFEHKGPVDALLGSHKLVWGNWWRTAAIFTLTGILMMVLYLALAFVLGLISPFAAMALGNSLVVVMAVQLISQAAINVLVMPFTCAVFIATYWDLKLRKQGGDLAARVNALSAA